MLLVLLLLFVLNYRGLGGLWLMQIGETHDEKRLSYLQHFQREASPQLKGGRGGGRRRGGGPP